MRMILGCLLGMVLLTSEAGAMSVLSPAKLALDDSSLIKNVKVICDESGHCYRPQARRPVARWVYGDNNFIGPYSGPGYYGSPAHRYRWLPFFW